MSKDRFGYHFTSDEARLVFKRVLELGWSHRKTGTGHVLVTSPDGTERINLSQTQNAKGRRMKNYWAAIRRWEKRNGSD